MTRSLRIGTRAAAAFLACLVSASPAMSFELPFTATLQLKFGAVPPLVIPGASTAEVTLAASGAIQRVQLAPSSIAATGVAVGPLPASFEPIDGLQGNFGLWSTSAPLPLRTFERGTNGRIAGVVRLLGSVRVCLFSSTGCPGTSDLFIRLDHATPGTGSLFYDGAVGWQGTWAGAGGSGVNLTVRAAPWTTGTVNAGGGLTAMGFAHGPASATGSTAQNGGQLNLVTPIFISTSIPNSPYFPAIGTLSVTFTGDPPACANGVDDDGDGHIDAATDPGCSNAIDPSEQESSLPCDDGIDNDADTFADFPNDPACQTSVSTREDTQCQDGANNDNDALIDFDGGA